ncbi:F510_1955 family glycosylhydrolase [Cellulomonas fimi]|uniref:F510_1955 family glycosylhydrolase n=1 Tax=Cellulomonas fimi TaxID=1708 RepID=UPI00031D18C1|nr:exo-alpha-sialidase [Cellulomonas fimi]
MALTACGADADAAAESPTVPQRDAGHVHTVVINPADGLTYLGTHGGLLRIDGDESTWVGPQIDLMGLVAAGPDHFYASGHPGAGTDLPDPVGLIESRDGGATWTPLSRQGESDFHTLAAAERGVLGFDGTTWSTQDGQDWSELEIPRDPFNLTVSASGEVIIATTPEGPLRSADAGATWEEMPAAPLLHLVDWVGGDEVVGITPDGDVWTSADAGVTWQKGSALPGSAVALTAFAASGGGSEIVAVADDALWRSTDAGGHFVRAVIPVPSD